MYSPSGIGRSIRNPAETAARRLRPAAHRERANGAFERCGRRKRNNALRTFWVACWRCYPECCQCLISPSPPAPPVRSVPFARAPGWGAAAQVRRKECTSGPCYTDPAVIIHKHGVQWSVTYVRYGQDSTECILWRMHSPVQHASMSVQERRHKVLTGGRIQTSEPTYTQNFVSPRISATYF